MTWRAWGIVQLLVIWWLGWEFILLPMSRAPGARDSPALLLIAPIVMSFLTVVNGVLLVIEKLIFRKR